MTAEYDVAQNEMLAVFNVAWLAGSAALCGYVPEVAWPLKELVDKPDGGKFWARISTQNVTEEQTSLSACLTESNNAMRTTAYGLLFVQIFCPKSVDNAGEIGEKLAKLVKNAYKGTKTLSGVWFRNVRINPLPAEDLWHRFNVVAETEYDEVS